MPRTRSIAWAELRVGIAVVVALALVVVIVIAIGGESGFWWQRYPAQGTVRRREGTLGRRGRSAERQRSRQRSRASISWERRLTSASACSKSVRSVVTTDSGADLGSISLLGEPIVNITPATSGTSARRLTSTCKTGGANGSMDQLTSGASAGIRAAGRSADGHPGRARARSARSSPMTRCITRCRHS